MPHLKDAYVVHESDVLGGSVAGGVGVVRETVNRGVGCQNLVQRVLRYSPGTGGQSRNEASEEVLFVVKGRGEAAIAGTAHPLRPNMGVLVPPAARCLVRSSGPGELVLVSVLSPQPGQPPGKQADAQLRADGKLSVAEEDEEAIPSGDGRQFKLLIDPRYGCRNLSQFVGVIQRSRAPDHSHTCEGVIYVLEGGGNVHVGEECLPVRRGSCIYLPPGLSHCLENSEEAPLRLVGVFCPAGDPGSRLEGAQG